MNKLTVYIIGTEINAHATCMITDDNSHNDDVHLNHLPAVRSDCQTWDKNVFINQMQHGVAIGCSVRILNLLLNISWQW